MDDDDGRPTAAAAKPTIYQLLALINSLLIIGDRGRVEGQQRRTVSFQLSPDDSSSSSSSEDEEEEDDVPNPFRAKSTDDARPPRPSAPSSSVFPRPISILVAHRYTSDTDPESGAPRLSLTFSLLRLTVRDNGWATVTLYSSTLSVTLT